MKGVIFGNRGGIRYISQFQNPPDGDTAEHGPPTVRRSVLRCDQSGHIPNVTPLDWQQRVPQDKEGVLGSAKGFGPWTFGWGEVSRTAGEVSRSAGTFKSAPGFEPTSWFRGGKEGTLGSAMGFGSWTFGWNEVNRTGSKVSRTGGKVSRSTGTFKTAPGFEPASWFCKNKASQLARYARLVRS